MSDSIQGWHHLLENSGWGLLPFVALGLFAALLLFFSLREFGTWFFRISLLRREVGELTDELIELRREVFHMRKELNRVRQGKETSYSEAPSPTETVSKLSSIHANEEATSQAKVPAEKPSTELQRSLFAFAQNLQPVKEKSLSKSDKKSERHFPLEH